MFFFFFRNQSLVTKEAGNWGGYLTRTWVAWDVFLCIPGGTGTYRINNRTSQGQHSPVAMFMSETSIHALCLFFPISHLFSFILVVSKRMPKMKRSNATGCTILNQLRVGLAVGGRDYSPFQLPVCCVLPI